MKKELDIKGEIEDKNVDNFISKENIGYSGIECK